MIRFQGLCEPLEHNMTNPESLNNAWFPEILLVKMLNLVQESTPDCQWEGLNTLCRASWKASFPKYSALLRSLNVWDTPVLPQDFDAMRKWEKRWCETYQPGENMAVWDGKSIFARTFTLMKYGPVPEPEDEEE